MAQKKKNHQTNKKQAEVYVGEDRMWGEQVIDKTFPSRP